MHSYRCERAAHELGAAVEGQRSEVPSWCVCVAAAGWRRLRRATGRLPRAAADGAAGVAALGALELAAAPAHAHPPDL